MGTGNALMAGQIGAKTQYSDMPVQNNVPVHCSAAIHRPSVIRGFGIYSIIHTQGHTHTHINIACSYNYI